jgi:hypothetical protein
MMQGTPVKDLRVSALLDIVDEFIGDQKITG